MKKSKANKKEAYKRAFLFLPFICILSMKFFHGPVSLTQTFLNNQQKQLSRINFHEYKNAHARPPLLKQTSCNISNEYLASALFANGCILISNPYKYLILFKGDHAV